MSRDASAGDLVAAARVAGVSDERVLERKQVLTAARFVRLHGRYGFPPRS
ncbi:MAG TPA: hypothetical protein VF933_21575 [Streptosporangiaceae bacterium]